MKKIGLKTQLFSIDLFFGGMSFFEEDHHQSAAATRLRFEYVRCIIYPLHRIEYSTKKATLMKLQGWDDYSCNIYEETSQGIQSSMRIDAKKESAVELFSRIDGLVTQQRKTQQQPTNADLPFTECSMTIYYQRKKYDLTWREQQPPCFQNDETFSSMIDNIHLCIIRDVYKGFLAPQ